MNATVDTPNDTSSVCDTLGCENPAENGTDRCGECTAVSPKKNPPEGGSRREIPGRKAGESTSLAPARSLSTTPPPKKLRERGRWVCWTYEYRDGPDEPPTKPPIAPFVGKKYASTSDPETWRSYEEAIIYHEREDTDTEGVGYVLGRNDLVAGADLDGCRDPETGDLEPWARDVIDRLDSYTEVSPGGYGLRVFVFAIMPDGGNRKGQTRTLDTLFDCEKNPEVELYADGRYLTFTGNHVEGTPETVEQRNDAFREIHAEYVAPPDDSKNNAGARRADSEPRPDPPGPHLDDEEVLRKARAAENSDKFAALENGDDSAHTGDDGKPDTSRADMAFLSHLAFWTGGDRAQMTRLFESSDRMRDKVRNRDDYLPRTIDAVLKKQTEFYEPGSGGASVDADTTATGSDSDLPIPAPSSRLTAQNGGYAVYHPPRNDDGEGWYEQITNFQLEANTFLRSEGGEGETRVNLTVHPAEAGEQYGVTVPLTAFNDPRTFKSEVVTGRTTTFDGGIGDLNALRRFVGSQAAPERTGVERMGLFPSNTDGRWELVSPTGVLGPGGWVDDPENVYVKQGIGLETKWSLTPNAGSDAGAEFDSGDVAEILEILPQTRESDRLLPVLGWFYAAGLRPLIHEWTGEFNVLNVTGRTESGKSSTLGLLWRLFGMDDDPLSVGQETKFAMTRSMAASNAVPVWFDEYKPSTIEQWRLDAFHGVLRDSTRGATVQRGNADKTTDEYRLSAPLVVSGEQRIQGSAEQRRSVMTTFSTASTRKGSPTARAYMRLVGESYTTDTGEVIRPTAPDPRTHALAYWRFVAGFDPDEARSLWDGAGVTVAEILADARIEGIGTAAQQGLQTVVFGLCLYREFAGTVDADVAGTIDEQTVADAVRFAALEYADGGHKSYVDALFELVSAAAQHGYLEGDEHYTTVRDKTPSAEIRVNMTAAFPLLTKFKRDFDVSTDILDTFDDYRERLKEESERGAGYVISYRQKSPPIGRAVGIHAARAADVLDGFSPRAFGCSTVRGVSEGEIESVGGNDIDTSGVPTDAEGSAADADRVISILQEIGQPYDRAALAARAGRDFDLSPDDVDAAILKLRQEGDIIEQPGPKYELNT